MYNQLFHTKPSIELILRCIQYLGYSELNDHNAVPRANMETSGAVAKFTTYYLNYWTYIYHVNSSYFAISP